MIVFFVVVLVLDGGWVFDKYIFSTMGDVGILKKKSMICTPLMGQSVEQMVSEMKKAKMEGADLVEMRLDYINDFPPSTGSSNHSKKQAIAGDDRLSVTLTLIYYIYIHTCVMSFISAIRGLCFQTLRHLPT